MKVVVVGIGYVGLSLAALLAQKHEVVALDVLQEKVDMINNKISPIKDEMIEQFFKTKDLTLRATLDYHDAFIGAKYIIISTPTNYNENTNYFDTSQVEDVIKKVIKEKSDAIIVVKSTVPVGFVESMKKKYNIDNIMFSPEFLREGNALYDNLYPSRIIVGEVSERAKEFAELLKSCSLKDEIPIKYMNSTEAEAVKLFANTYLALRVSFFNELDTYAELNKLSTKDIIEGICLDSRIGEYYNNPSFGYGGYCLPKDTKQLLKNYDNIPQNLIKAIVQSNETRKEHIANTVLNKGHKIVGIYRLSMKTNSDNFRNSAIHSIINFLYKNDIEIIIYEPTIKERKYKKFIVEKNIEKFKEKCDIILANRFNDELNDIIYKVYTRDIFKKD